MQIFIACLIVAIGAFFLGVWLAPVVRGDYNALKKQAKEKAVGAINKL